MNLVEPSLRNRLVDLVKAFVLDRDEGKLNKPVGNFLTLSFRASKAEKTPYRFGTS